MGPLRGPSDTSPPFLLLLLFLGAFLRATSCGAAQPRVLFFSLFYFLFFFPYFSLFSFTFRFFAGAPRLACSRPYCLRAARGRGGERPPAVCPGCCGGGSTRTHPQKYTNTRRSTQTHAYIHTNTPPGWPPASLLAIQPIDVLLGGGEINKTSSFADATLYLSLFGFC